MVLLAAFLEVILRSLVMLGECAGTGGIVFALAVLRPQPELSAGAVRALRRTLLLVLGGSLLVAAAQALFLVVEPWALADDLGRWPLSALALCEWRVVAGGLRGTRWRFALPLLCLVGGRCSSPIPTRALP